VARKVLGGVLPLAILEVDARLRRQHHRVHPNITYAQRHLHNVSPERDGRFDLVFSAYTLHHVTDLEQTLKQLRGLLTAGGQALLVDIVGDPGLIDTHGHTPRSYFLEEAAGGYARDLAAGRPPDEAAELLALKLHPAWLEY
jgi:2-polyprenyl-3-methyl-5-hydroxy-6-metoxy-1,4-benzoquinol methylase